MKANTWGRCLLGLLVVDGFASSALWVGEGCWEDEGGSWRSRPHTSQFGCFKVLKERDWCQWLRSRNDWVRGCSIDGFGCYGF